MPTEPRWSAPRAALMAVVLLIVGASGIARGAGQAQAPESDPVLGEAARLFMALDYERAVPALDRVIEQLQSKTPLDAASRTRLASALEMRGRAHFGLGDTAGARADFKTLVTVEPGHVMAGKVSPRVVAVFEEIRKANVGKILLNLSPIDADLELDGAPWQAAAGQIPIAAGPHVIKASRRGYRPASQEIAVSPDAVQEVAIALERVASVVSIVTSPPDVDVIVDGASRGRTEAGDPGPEYLQSPNAAGLAVGALSARLVLTDLALGSHLIEFSRDCHVRTERRIQIDKPADYRLDLVKLERAVGSVFVDPSTPGGTVYLDGQAKGPAPLSMDDVCEGRHLVELRAPHGRFVERVDVHRGDKVSLQATIKPVFAILSASGGVEGGRGATDVREEAERLLSPARMVTMIAPPRDQADRALKAEGLSARWLSFDTARRPLHPIAGSITDAARRDVSGKLARALDVQGVAEVTVAPGQAPGRLLLSLLAPGSAQPDVVELSPDDPARTASTLARLNDLPPLFRLSSGLFVIDVLDVPGVVIAAIDATARAAAPTLAPGDVIVSANNQRVTDAASFARIVAQRRAGDRLPLDVQDRSGASTTTAVPVVQAPRLIPMADDTLLFNALILGFRARALTAATPTEESVIRLNLAAAHIRVGDFNDALTELERVRLPDGPGVSNGTVLYLLGLCYQATGRTADAERSYRAASAGSALLTEDGPAVKDLAEQKLSELKRTPMS